MPLLANKPLQRVEIEILVGNSSLVKSNYVMSPSLFLESFLGIKHRIVMPTCKNQIPKLPDVLHEFF